MSKDLCLKYSLTVSYNGIDKTMKPCTGIVREFVEKMHERGIKRVKLVTVEALIESLEEKAKKSKKER